MMGGLFERIAYFEQIRFVVGQHDHLNAYRHSRRRETGGHADRGQPGLGCDQRVGRKAEDGPATVAQFFAGRRQHLAGREAH